MAYRDEQELGAEVLGLHPLLILRGARLDGQLHALSDLEPLLAVHPVDAVPALRRRREGREPREDGRGVSARLDG